MTKYLVKDVMEWFDDESNVEVTNIDGSVVIETEDGFGGTDMELVEMIGNIVYCETEDFEFTASLVYTLASRLGLLGMLNYDIPELKVQFEDEFENIL